LAELTSNRVIVSVFCLQELGKSGQSGESGEQISIVMERRTKEEVRTNEWIANNDCESQFE
jgi:hypothetical protein